MSKTISVESKPMPADPTERFLLNFATALYELRECRKQDIDASLMVLFARMKTSDSDCIDANADHTVFGDFRMHLENISQLLSQFIEHGSPGQRLMVRELMNLAITQLNDKE